MEVRHKTCKERKCGGTSASRYENGQGDDCVALS